MMKKRCYTKIGTNRYPPPNFFFGGGVTVNLFFNIIKVHNSTHYSAQFIKQQLQSAYLRIFCRSWSCSRAPETDCTSWQYSILISQTNHVTGENKKGYNIALTYNFFGTTQANVSKPSLFFFVMPQLLLDAILRRGYRIIQGGWGAKNQCLVDLRAKLAKNCGAPCLSTP